MIRYIINIIKRSLGLKTYKKDNMTKVLFYTKETETKGRCYAVHNQPHLLTEEQKKQGDEVSDVPEKPQTNRGESAVRYVNPQTGKVWHEVVTRPLNDEEKKDEKMENLEKRVTDLESKIKK